MDREDLERILSEALDILYVQAKAIITVDAAERSICARLAAILQRYFEGLSVDTDYNRHGVVPKEIDLPDSDGVLTANLVSPDIIVHTPGHDGDNLLVIEAKKTTNPQPDGPDLRKLEQIKGQIGYRFAAFLRLPAGANAVRADVRITWV